ncbi:MAG TPA: amino acid adenylation domain-containing protein, partial [Algoriphagus sp.]|nr:amino acid adenylation domain-containing protein [Algoriphagus sp.]
MDYPKSFYSQNVFDLVEQAFSLFPDLEALIFNEERITYSELKTRVADLAALISTKIPEEKLIAVSCTRSIQTIVNILAILSSGKAYLPIDFDLPLERIQKIVSETQVRFGLAGNSLDSFDSLKITEITPSMQGQEGVESVSSDLAYIIFTSGSTGTPKGISIPHPGLINFMEWQNSASNSGPGFNTLHFAKLTFDISVQEIFSTLSTGGTLFIAENSTLKDPLLLLEFVEKNQINRIFFPFIALQGLCNAANAYQIYPKSLKEIMTAGEQLKVSLAVRKFFKKMEGCVLFNHYGPTETTIITTELRLEGDPDNWEDLPTIGKAISGTELTLVNEEGKLITQPGVIGEIYISGVGLAIGYFNNPVLTSQKFVELSFEGREPIRYFKTGDLAEWTQNGELKFRSRIDDQIKISGFRVELSDIEANVSKIEGIDENVVITDFYSDGELYLKLFYTSQDNTLTNEVIRRKLENVLPEYMIPAQFKKVDFFPKTTSGKVDRKTLAKSDNIQLQSPKVTKELESKNTEKTLRKIWMDVLQVVEVSSESNFFNLGGRSILAQKLSLEISEKLGIRFPVAFAYQYPTLNSQLKYLQGKDKSADSHSEKTVDPKESVPSRDVAVIAMAGKFPKANNIQEFWDMIKNKEEGISFFDLDEIDPLIHAEAQEPNYVKARGIVEGVENFDPEYFGMNPKLASIMDPQQRLFLEICHEALEKAGWIANRPSYKIGVFGGSNYNSYFNKNIVFDQELLDVFGAIPILSLNEKDYLTSRTAFQLNLNGPAVSVYSACSTSLLAVAQAVESIRNGQCVAALAGGSSVTFPVKSGQFHEEGAVFSSDGHCRPFDANSTGTMFCDGAGIVLLKSYEQAVQDGDTIFAVIKGVAVNNDGSEKANFTSPSILGQAEVIKSAIADAGIDPSQIGFIEAHGTATPIGDPIEIEGLKLAFGENVPFQNCSISSVKSNIGHLTAAAGVAGLIKAICALHEKVLPATYGFENPNPEIDFEHSPFYVQKDTSPWTGDRKRIAGVSSFGFGGTNVHVIVEEFVGQLPQEGDNSQSDILIAFSAKTEKSLTNYAKQLFEYATQKSDLNLSQLSHNLLKRKAPYRFQQSFRVTSNDQLLDLLKKVGDGEIKPIQSLGEFNFPVFLFPGQGAQYVGMGKSLYESNDIFRQAFDRCCEGFDRYLPTSLKFEIFEGSSDTLANTRYTQPAIFTVSYSLSIALMDMGIQPAAFCGHSIGEYVGAHLAGVFSLDDVIKIIAYRGKLISDLPGGNMLSVRSKTDIIQEILPNPLSIAAHNAPNLCVVSGPVESIEEFKTVLDGYSIPGQVLKTSHAFHSGMMDGALEEFSKVIASVDRNSPKIPVMSTQTGYWLTDSEAQSVEYWTGHLRNAVLFSDAAGNLLNELPEAYFIEVGPGSVLNSLLQQQPESKNYPIIHTLSKGNTESEKAFLIEQLGVANAKGAKIDLVSVLGFTRFEFLDIPTYAFDKKLCWNQNGALANPYFQ